MDVDRERGLPLLFNGLVEVAARMRAVLNSCYPHSFTLDELRRLDYFAVFARDAGGPRHLHPALEGRALAHEARERAVVAAFEFLVAAGEAVSDEANPGRIMLNGDRVDMSGMVGTPYMRALLENTGWMAAMIEGRGRDGFLSLLDGYWPELDRTLSGYAGLASPRLTVLHSIYSSDLQRLEAISEMAFLFARWLEWNPLESASGTVPGAAWFELVDASAQAEARNTVSERLRLESLISGLPGTEG